MNESETDKQADIRDRNRERHGQGYIGSERQIQTTKIIIMCVSSEGETESKTEHL